MSFLVVYTSSPRQARNIPKNHNRHPKTLLATVSVTELQINLGICQQLFKCLKLLLQHSLLQTKIVGILSPIAVFFFFFDFWLISSSSQCCLPQLTHQILHNNIGRMRRQQSVPTILTETVAGILNTLLCPI